MLCPIQRSHSGTCMVHDRPCTCTAWLLIWEPRRICTFRASVPKTMAWAKKGNGQQKDYPFIASKEAKKMQNRKVFNFFCRKNGLYATMPFQVPFETVYQVALQPSYISIRCLPNTIRDVCSPFSNNNRGLECGMQRRPPSRSFLNGNMGPENKWPRIDRLIAGAKAPYLKGPHNYTFITRWGPGTHLVDI